MSQIRMFPMIWNANGDIINGRDLGKKKKCNDNRTRHVNFPAVKKKLKKNCNDNRSRQCHFTSSQKKIKKLQRQPDSACHSSSSQKQKLQRQPNSACHFTSSRRILNEGNGHGDVSNGRDLEKEKCNDNRTRHVTLPAVGGY